MPAKWITDAIKDSPETKLRLKETQERQKLEEEKKKKAERRETAIVKTLNAFSGWSAITKFAKDFDIAWEYLPCQKIPTYDHLEDEGYEHPCYVNKTSEGFKEIFFNLEKLNSRKYFVLAISFDYDDVLRECKIIFELRFGGSSFNPYSSTKTTPISADALYSFLRQESLKFINHTETEEPKSFWKKIFS